MIAYALMIAVTFALLIYWNRREVFKESLDSFNEGMFISLYLAIAFFWPVTLPVAIIIVGTKQLMHYLMRGNE